MASKNTKTFEGFCPICERNIALNKKNLFVHHGYQRPGDGEIHGDCFAVRKLPYELSIGTCLEYSDYMEAAIERLTESLAYFQSDNVIEMCDASSAMQQAHRERFDAVRTPHRELTAKYTYSKNDADKHRVYMFERLLEAKIRELNHQKSHAEYEVRRMVTMIAAWSLRPTRERPADVIDTKKTLLWINGYQLRRDASGAYVLWLGDARANDRTYARRTEARYAACSLPRPAVTTDDK